MASTTTEHFTRALELTHTYNPYVNRHERLMAEEYLMNLRATAEGLNLSFHIVSNEPVHDVRCFWAFNTIMHHLPSLGSTIDDTQAEELYKTLFSFIYRYFFSSATVGRQTMDFVANKHAQMMVVGLQNFFPSRWCSFFNDAFGLLTRSTSLPQVQDAVTVYFLRIFEYIDERVVSVRSQSDRGREQRARDMEVKDAMRECVMPRTVSTWYSVLCESRVRSPDVANVCLGVIQTYVEWVDVGLFMTPEWINLLYFLITMPSLRCAACECLLGLVEKKQLPAVKLESLLTLNVLDAVPRIASLVEVPVTTEQELEDSFLEVVTRLVRSVADHFLSLYEHIATQSPSAVNILASSHFDSLHEQKQLGQQQQQQQQQQASDGLNCRRPIQESAQPQQQSVVNFVSGSLSPDAFSVVDNALQTVVVHLLRLLHLDRSEVRAIVLPFVQNYIKSAALCEQQAVQLLPTLYEQTKIRGLAQHSERMWMDDVILERKQLHNLTRLLFRRYPDIVLQHLREVIFRIASNEPCSEYNGSSAVIESNSHLSTAGTSDSLTKMMMDDAQRNPEEVETALRYFYELGESMRMEKLRDVQNECSQLLCAILSSERIAQNTSPVVHLSYFELFDRYASFFMYHRAYIPLLLQRILLLPNGVTNRHDRVRGRICYYFGRLVQVLRPCLTLHRDDIINALHAICSSPTLLPSDRRELYVAAGMLMSNPSNQNNGSSVTSANNNNNNNNISSSNNNNNNNADSVNSNNNDNGICMMAQLLQGLAQNLGEVSCSSPTDPARGEAVADAISFLSAFAKGLHGDGPLTSNSTGASRGSGVLSGTPMETTQFPLEPLVLGATAEMFYSITRNVMESVNVWHGAASVRDRAAQYFTQMLHMLPFESLEMHFDVYVTSWLAWMEAIPELTKLLRLMFQFVHRNGPRSSAVLAHVLPLILAKVASVGELSFPHEEMGVVSENTREKLDVYRQLFTLLHGVTTSGCAGILFSLPEEERKMLEAQLIAALFLPTETELPKLTLQTMNKLTAASLEFGMTSGCSEKTNETNLHLDRDGLFNSHDSPHSQNQNENMIHTTGTGHSKDHHHHHHHTINNNNNHHHHDNDVHQSPLSCSGSDAWVGFMVREVVHSVLKCLLSPSFDLKDAKNLFLVGESGILLKTLMDRLGPSNSSLCVLLYNTFEPLVGPDEATSFLTTLQTEQRFTPAMKMRLRNLLQGSRNGTSIGT